MKTMLFLFPIEEYMQMLWRDRPELINLLNETINTRYRQKGYRIVYLTFKNKPIYGIDFFEDDKIVEGNITFEEHTTPISKDETGQNVYQYTSNEHIQKMIGDFEELVICGFHAQDCVMRVAEYFYHINSNTIVDEELTDFLGTLSRRFYFNKDIYNLANRLSYDRAEDMLMYKKPFMVNFEHYVERFKKPYFHVDKFKADFTVDECMGKLMEIDEAKRQSRRNK